MGDRGPVAQRVVRGKDEPGTGARGEAQPCSGRAAQVAAKEEEQQKDSGSEFQRGGDADEDSSRPSGRPGQAVERMGSSSSAAGSAQGSSRRILAPASAAGLTAKRHRLAATLTMVTAVSSQLAVR